MQLNVNSNLIYDNMRFSFLNKIQNNIEKKVGFLSEKFWLKNNLMKTFTVTPRHIYIYIYI